MQLPDLEITPPLPISPKDDWASISLKGVPPLFIKDGRDYFSDGMHLALDNALQQGPFSTFNGMLSFFAEKRKSLQRELVSIFNKSIKEELVLVDFVLENFGKIRDDISLSSQGWVNLSDIENTFTTPVERELFSSVIRYGDKQNTHSSQKIKKEILDQIDLRYALCPSRANERSSGAYRSFSTKLEKILKTRSFSYDRNFWVNQIIPTIQFIEAKILEKSFNISLWNNCLTRMRDSIDLISTAGDVLSLKQFQDLIEALDLFKVRWVSAWLRPEVNSFGIPREIPTSTDRGVPRGHWTTPLSAYWIEHEPEINEYFQNSNIFNLSTVLLLGSESIKLTTYLGNLKDKNIHFLHTDPEKFPIIKRVLEDVFQNVISGKENALEGIAKMHWLSANAMFFERGSASINQLMSAYLMTVFGKGKFKPAAWKKMPDFMALITPQEDFVAAFKKGGYGGFT